MITCVNIVYVNVTFRVATAVCYCSTTAFYIVHCKPFKSTLKYFVKDVYRVYILLSFYNILRDHCIIILHVYTNNCQCE